MVVLLLLGAAAYFQLGQDEDPPFTFRLMVVRAFWPGASAPQMADQVADRIEKTLQDVPYVDRITSYTKPGELLTLVELKGSTPPREVAGTWYQVRKRVGDARGTLPAGVQGPYFNDDFGDVFGTIYALSADGFSMEDLRVHADRVRQRLLQVPDVGKVELFGVQEEKVYVEVSHKRLAQLGLDMAQVLAQLGAQNAVEGAGVLDAGSENVQVRIGGQFNSVEQLRAFPLRAVNAQTGAASSIRLGDIAEIRRGYVDPPGVKVRHQGQEVVAIGISMARGGDVIALGKRLDEAARSIRAALPAGIEMAQVQDQPRAVSRSVNEFIKVLVEAVVIVLAVSFVSLGLHFKPRLRLDTRPGMVVAVTIPLVLAITFVVMYYWGVGLHKISLGSLIIALGLLVDDAIIAVEMMVRKLEEGYDKVRAATFAYDVTAMPMLTGTLITAAGFLPIGTAKLDHRRIHLRDLRGDDSPRSSSRGSSRSTSCPTSARCCCARGRRSAGEAAHELFDTPFYARFRRTVGWCVAHRWTTIGLTLAVFALGIVGMGRVQQQFFPGFEPPRGAGRPVAARGQLVRADRGGGAPLRGAHAARARRRQRHHLDRQRRAALLPAARPDLPADRTSARRSSCRRAWSSARRCGSGCRRSSPTSSPRCARASSCCPTGRRCSTRCSSR